MSNNIRFVSTRLQNTGKKNILKPDENGYYRVVLGGLNIVNSVGEFYTADGNVRSLFSRSSDLMRRIENRNLKGENGHPKQMPGEKKEDYYRRAMTIEETNISHHILSVELDESFGRNNPEFKNPDIVGIIGMVCPCGPHGPALKAELDNPMINVNFSIRALSRNSYRSGRTIRTLEHIETWDWVTEPGLAVANKYSSPSLESFVDMTLSERVLNSVMSNSRTPLATESAKNMANRALELIHKEQAARQPVVAAGWSRW